MKFRLLEDAGRRESGPGWGLGGWRASPEAGVAEAGSSEADGSTHLSPGP